MAAGTGELRAVTGDRANRVETARRGRLCGSDDLHAHSPRCWVQHSVQTGTFVQSTSTAGSPRQSPATA
ncbi:hypothetical protein Henu3_gp31 [Mycobacterium phage Henu3]|uniref:Uncharacterized protein n=1 Tax=Mycobacterium phage Henu3 TaxID=2492961 RepID=A0A410T838_9CAUD|nr:hypothetical protein I5G68_gp28 [Mycobacterium phage Henu3]QAU04975.1 hypothetical protein Henu3_gp31 [Mycobacterium phage Henu3]